MEFRRWCVDCSPLTDMRLCGSLATLRVSGRLTLDTQQQIVPCGTSRTVGFDLLPISSETYVAFRACSCLCYGMVPCLFPLLIGAVVKRFSMLLGS